MLVVVPSLLAWRPLAPPDNQEGGFSRRARAPHPRRRAAPRPRRRRVPGGSPRARSCTRDMAPSSPLLSPLYLPSTPPKPETTAARAVGDSGRGARRTRSPRAHPHPRSANPPFWFSAGAERRHHRRARTTTHTTPSSRRVAYLARRSRNPRSARCSAHLTPRTGGRGDRACAAAPPYRRFFVTFQNKMTWKANLLFAKYH